jgi:3',5'-cyclic AMP phosphodiesterase CpdA
MVLIGLDSNAEATDVILACGKLGDRQLGWLDRFLAELPPMWFPVILLHHHPFDESIGTRLVDADGFRSCINRRLKGRKSLVLFGHKHGSDKLRRSGATYFQSPSSVVSDRNRLRFRVLTVSHQGIEDTWDGCKVPKT